MTILITFSDPDFQNNLFRFCWKSEVVCWLIRHKASVRAPGQTSKQNTKSICSAISSQRISGKISECI